MEIHWLSIINSCVLVTLLMAFLAIIFMRILKNDFARYMDIEEDAIDEEEVRICAQNGCNSYVRRFADSHQSLRSLDGN
jgi:4-hydroxybenzoate polyprenyltransferase